jgi:hypothetical protein
MSLAQCSFALTRSASPSVALLRFALLRFAPLRFAPLRFAPLRFAPLRFAATEIRVCEVPLPRRVPAQQLLRALGWLGALR